MTAIITTNSKIANASSASPQAKSSKASSDSDKPSRLDQLEALLTSSDGASIVEMTIATGWQAHSVRGAMAGALKKRGLAITSDKVDGIRRYRAAKSQ